MADTQKHLYELLKEFSNGMLVTVESGGKLHARPMQIAKLATGSDAYFATGRNSSKVSEIANDPNVMIIFQGSSVFATVTGRASISDDPKLIEELWQEAWRIWFPKGKTDPNLCIIRVEATSGEYWDNSGFNGLRYMFEGLKSMVVQEPPTASSDQHAKVTNL